MLTGARPLSAMEGQARMTTATATTTTTGTLRLGVLHENLARALSTVSPALPKRATLPITDGALLATDGGRLRVMVTDLDVAITTWVGAQIDAEGGAVIPARLLIDHVRAMRGGIVTLSVTQGRRAKLECGRQVIQLPSYDAEDFPLVNPVEDGFGFEVDPHEFTRAINIALTSVASDNQRPSLTGVSMRVRDGLLQMASADGFRLTVVNHPGEFPEELGDSGVIVPGSVLRAIARIAARADGVLTVRFDAAKTRIVFSLEDVEVSGVLIQGTFPNYDQLIPDESITTVMTSVADLLATIRSAAITARDGSGVVRLYADQPQTNEVIIRAQADEIGEFEARCDAEIDGPAMRIAFDARYLDAALANLGEDKARIRLLGPERPAVFEPGEGDWRHVVMPMTVHW